MKDRKLLYISLSIVLGLWFGAAVFIFISGGSWSEKSNMFNSFNSFLSTIVLAGTVYAIFLQRHELSLQRKELKLTRKELSRTSKAQERISSIEFHKFLASDPEVAKIYFEPIYDDIENHNIFIYAHFVLSGLFNLYVNKDISSKELSEKADNNFKYKNGFISLYWNSYRKIESIENIINKYRNTKNKTELTDNEVFIGIFSEAYEKSKVAKSNSG